MKHFAFLFLLAFSSFNNVNAQLNAGSNHGNRFEELNYLLSTPNIYRTASGAPGPSYWQQRADYDISVDLNEVTNVLTGSETITYYNNSPNPLSYIWLQLDENFHQANSNNNYSNTSSIQPNMSDVQLSNLEPWRKLAGYGLNITKATDATGKNLTYTINQTMMRVELPATLKPGQRFILNLAWNYKIPDKVTRYGRGGFEHFAEDDNNLYSIAQFYPRLAVYSDFQGWQLLQFVSGAEFALTFGNFKVKITVPSDHIVAATGECQNLRSLISGAQYQRWQQAQIAKEPIEIVTLAEAISASSTKSTTKKTWIFEAKDVRDFAFNSSRRLVWDAMPIIIDGKKIMCMSFYGKEAYPIYRRYSTKVTAHTLKVYSRFSVAYPYPVAQSVEAAIGMEYPMLAMNYGRAERDGSYNEAVKNGAIGVIIHEVGHNFFPMIVNSDERQFWWMDEGLNSFVQFLTEQEFDPNFPSRRGPAHLITNYMKLPKNLLEPIMTKGDVVVNVGSNAYAKAATGLNILRETIMGRELFDYAFKEYSKRWAFKHPTASDFFRTMEDASGVDLDWFWRGWFFGTDPVDISLDDVKWYKTSGDNKAAQNAAADNISKMRNRQIKEWNYAVDTDTSLRDFYFYNPGADTMYNNQSKLNQALTFRDNNNAAKWADKNFYELTFSNKGGMLMPLLVEWTYKDGTKELDKIPVSIWMHNEQQVTKVFIKEKEVASVTLDPYKETADIDESNNVWPLRTMPSRFELFKAAQPLPSGQSAGGNSMQRANQTPR